MAGVTIVVDDREVREALAALLGRMATLRPVLDRVGAMVLKQTQQRFRDQVGPDGVGWPPSRRVQDLDRRTTKDTGQTLRDTGRLRNSLTYQSDDRTVAVGTNVVYAAMMQFGAEKGRFGMTLAWVKEHQRRIRFKTKKGEWSKRNRRSQTVRAHTRRMLVPWGDIPPRPFLGMNDENRGKVMGLLQLFLMRGARPK